MRIVKPALLDRPQTVEVRVDPLTDHDCCDRCNARAFTRFTKESSEVFGNSLTLLLCGHHARLHEIELIGRGWNLHDERHVLESLEGQNK